MAEEANYEAMPLFGEVHLAIIPSDRLDVEEADEIVRTVVASGGTHVMLRASDQQIDDLAAVTHIVSLDIEFPQYSRAIESGIFVVKPSWIHQSHRKGKLAGPRQHSPDPSQFFHDVVMTCGDLPDGDKDAIMAGVMALGGQYSGPLTILTTHIVTLRDDHTKCVMAKAKKVNCKSVLPHWFDTCFRLGKKINERPYMFPNPPLLHAVLPRPAMGDSPHVGGATAAMPTGTPPSTPPPSPSKTRKNLNAFMGKKVKLSPDLKIGQSLTRTLGELISHGGGMMTDDVGEADIYIGQYRDGADYLAASRARKEVANLSWLYHVINLNKYTNPLSKLLHYPVPRKGIPGFENMKISISNYNGEARTYLENVIKYCGAEFTKTMKQDNTHLITAHTRSEKYEAAQEWNIHITNHLWLEESYAKCTVQTLSNAKYSTFPPVTNLSEVCGQTTLDMKRVEQVFFPAPRESPPKTMQSPLSNAKSKPIPHYHYTLPASSIAAASYTPSKTAIIDPPSSVAEEAEDAETESEPEEEPKTAKKPLGRPSKVAPTPAAKDAVINDETPAETTTAPSSRGGPRRATATPRHLDDEKENTSPMVTTSGRAARAKALERIHNAAPDIALYEKETKRKGGVTHGGRRANQVEDFSSPVPDPKKSKKRKSDENTYDVTAEGSDLSDGETQAKLAKGVKKVKTTTSDLPQVRYRMMVTGDDRWVGNMKQEDTDKRKLRALGISLTLDPKDVDILVAPSIKRTRKFVAALASAPLVVDTRYLDAALTQNKLVENPSTLLDRKAEEAMGCTLVDALKRAKLNQHQLLRGWSIFVTAEIAGGFETYKEIINVNGGEAFLYKGRTGLTLPKRRLRDAPPPAGSQPSSSGTAVDDKDAREVKYDHIYLVAGDSDAEVKLFKAFRALAEKQGLVARVVKSEWLLNAAMAQEVRWDGEWEWLSPA
ncbi:hypothetical protein B0A54_14481 [Friedmanniomyces endolithicus]|uniref:BRCT domain-containing protein n=1 Tax=Friedmanniomyces endolithicus TaxID=329885 RepID=A0A4U0UAC9_9PEZI|nr:regulator of Ty1 Transposition [Friedmanniomyces endolithicus]TKA32330.1 hypothetical protein B0A54_14481 [Friedmanniomyces endolithicus]